MPLGGKDTGTCVLASTQWGLTVQGKRKASFHLEVPFWGTCWLSGLCVLPEATPAWHSQLCGAWLGQEAAWLWDTCVA